MAGKASRNASQNTSKTASENASKNSLSGHSALVTGGSRGLGLLIAARLAHRGCRVTILARDAEELQRAAQWIEDRTGAAVGTEVCDVREAAAVAETVGRVSAEQHGLDVVVANAGVIQVAPVTALDAPVFQDAMSTIFGGAVHVSLAALPHLRESPDGGRLAVIGSVGALLSVPHLLPYSCAKAAVGALGEGLRSELAGTGVSVTTVHPGLMRTGSHGQAEFGGQASREFGWFSAIAGTPVVSMDAERAAERIVRAMERRRTRLVLTPAAHAASLAHGVAPTLVVRLSGLANRLLPDAPDTGEEAGMRQGHSLQGAPRKAWAERIRRWGSALNDRAARRYNEVVPGPPTSSS
ncbi:SDR family NAD(P)-dependent oxidoreductase [Streptomyces sp. NPDC023838]|uniref:SDR family NAD(P)-dependent oxidoreductase n=1 Tax=Streptomyces sp. NPDC023838 TaxID=3154325 RepID=UPI0033ED26BA